MMREPRVQDPVRRRRIALFLSAVSVGLLPVNFSVINIALADIAHDLHATTADLQWIVNAYTLVFGGLLLTAGSLGDRFGRAHFMALGIGLLAAGSTVAAFAPSPEVLITGRAILGAGAACIGPATLSTITGLYDSPVERLRAVGIWSGAGSIGFVIGPILGGALLSMFWWGSVFLVNVPVTLALLVAVRRWVPNQSSLASTRLDPAGMLLSMAAFTMVVWATIEAPILGWASARIVGGFAAALVLLGAFVVCELRRRDPMLDLSVLRNPKVSAAMIGSSAPWFTVSGTLVLVSIMLRTTFELGPLDAGTRLVPAAVTTGLFAYFSPRIAERLGTRATVTGGLALSVFGCIVLAAIGTDHGYVVLICCLVFLAAGNSVAHAPGVGSVLTELGPARAGLASGLNNTIRQVAGAMGVATMGSLLSAGYRSELGPRLAELDLGPSATSRAEGSITGAIDVAAGLDGGRGNDLVRAAEDAFATGFRAAAIAGAVVCAVGMALAARYLPPRKAPGGYIVARSSPPPTVGERAAEATATPEVAPLTVVGVEGLEPPTSAL